MPKINKKQEEWIAKKLKEFDKEFGELFIIANGQNDNAQITTTPSYVGNLANAVKNFIYSVLLQAQQQAYKQGKTDDLDLRKDYNDIKPEIIKEGRRQAREEMKKEILGKLSEQDEFIGELGEDKEKWHQAGFIDGFNACLAQVKSLIGEDLTRIL